MSNSNATVLAVTPSNTVAPSTGSPLTLATQLGPLFGAPPRSTMTLSSLSEAAGPSSAYGQSSGFRGSSLFGKDVATVPTVENLALSGSAVANGAVIAAYSASRRLFLRTLQPQVTVRRASDSATVSFYGIAGGGALMTSGASNGTSLSAWLGGSTGFVTQLWDQLGSNHLVVGSTLGVGATGPPPTIVAGSNGVFAVALSSNGPGLVPATGGSVPAQALALSFYYPGGGVGGGVSQVVASASNASVSNLVLRLVGASGAVPVGRSGIAQPSDMGYYASNATSPGSTPVVIDGRPVSADSNLGASSGWRLITLPTSGGSGATPDRLLGIGGGQGQVSELLVYSSPVPLADSALLHAVPPQATATATALAATLGPVAIAAGSMGTVTFSAGASYYGASVVAAANVASFFKNLGQSALSYSVSSAPFSNATIASASSGGALTVFNAGSGTTYRVAVTATNGTVSATSYATVIEPTAIAPALSATTTLPMTVLGTNTATFNAASCFANLAYVSAASATFAVTSNPQSSASVDPRLGTLSVVGNNRGLPAPYVVTVTATNASGLSASASVQIVEPPASSGLSACYLADSWNTGGVTGWRDMYGSHHVTSFGGSIAKNSGALNGMATLSGTAAAPASALNFPSTLQPASYTIFSLARYTNASANRGRILTSLGTNWLTGHWGGYSGVAFHNAWMTPMSDAASPELSWTLSSDQNGLYRWNGNTRSTGSSAGSPSHPSGGLSVNGYASELSDWTIACVLVFSATLNSTQIMAVESWIASMYGIAITVSASFVAPSSLAAAYSLRRFVGAWAGAVVGVRRGLDNAVADFYTDAQQTGGELWTGPAVSQGTSLTAWLGGSAASVVAWYDQSGGGNHAYNYVRSPLAHASALSQTSARLGTVASSQPTLVRHCGYWAMRFRMWCASTLFFTTPIQPLTLVAQFNDVNAGTLVTTEYDYGQRMYATVLTAGNSGDWYVSAGGTKFASIDGATVATNSSASGWWRSWVLSSTAPNWSTSQVPGGQSAKFTRIGSDGFDPSGRGLEGYLSELCFHNTALNAFDADAIYRNRFSPYSPATFPPGAMTSAASTAFAASAGQGAAWTTDGGVFVASASSAFSSQYAAWTAFSLGVSAAGAFGWTTAGNYYTGGGSAYAGSATTAGYAGEWLQLQCPQTLLLTGFSITVGTGLTARAPASFALLGSANGGVAWVALDVRSGVTGWVANAAATFVPNQAINTPVSTLRLVVRQTSGDSWLSLYSVQFQGYPQTVAPSGDSVVYGGQTLWLDATNSTGQGYTYSGTTTYLDQSGNGWNFPLYNLSYTPVNTAPFGSYFGFGAGTQRSLTRGSSGDVPFSSTSVNTVVAVQRFSPQSSDWRTFFRGYSADHHVIVQLNSGSIGLFDNSRSTGFVPCDTPIVLGTTPGTTTAFTSFNLMVWKLSASAPYYRFYMNPSSISALAAGPLGQIATNANAALSTGTSYIGGMPGGQNAGDTAEFFWFARELSDAELVALFNFYQPIYALPAALPTASMPAQCRGLFALTPLYGYAGAVLRVVRSGDGAATDVYSVAGGQLCTSAAGTTSIASWLAATSPPSSASVSTWYDQSGSGNHATMATASSQPALLLQKSCLWFGGAQYLSLPDGTFPAGNAKYTITTRVGSIAPGNWGGLWGSGGYGGVTGVDDTLALVCQNGQYYNNYWWGDDLAAGIPGAGDVVTCRYDQSTRFMYVNGALVGTRANVNARNSAPINNTIGVSQSRTYYHIGDLSYLAIYQDSLSDLGRAAVEALSSPSASGVIGLAPLATAVHGLLNYWSFESASAFTDAVDGVALSAVGGTPPAVPTGGPVPGRAASFAANAAGSNAARYLSGTLSIAPAGSMTLSAWFYPLVLPGSGVYSAICAVGALRLLIVGGAVGSSSVAFLNAFFLDASAGWQTSALFSTSYVLLSGWNHAAVVYAPKAGQQLYLNGVLVASSAVNGAISAISSSAMIAWDGGSGRAFQGYVDEVALYGRALTAAEISTLFGATAYPPAAMSAATTTLSGQAYGNGTYVATSSTSHAGNVAYFSFTRNAGIWWHGAAGMYVGGYTGSAATTTVDGAAVLGDWIQLQLPAAIAIACYQISPRIECFSFRSPVNFVLAGSNDGATWTRVDARSGAAWTNASAQVFGGVLNGTTAFSYLRLITTSIGGSNADSVQIADMRFFAAPFPSAYMPALDGSTAARAAPSAAAIKALTGTNVDGVYWINLPAVGATRVYCIMDSRVDGGGWMMAMKSAAAGATFTYSSPYWTNGGTSLNASDATRSAGDAKFETFNRFASKDLMAIWPDIGVSGGTIALPTAAYGSVWCWLKNSYNGGAAQALTSFFGGANNVSFSSTTGSSSVPVYPEAGNVIFSQQLPTSFYGANVTLGNNQVDMQVRWGMIFNENNPGDFSSCDVMGGIGMGAMTRAPANSYACGDWFGCCGYQGISRGARVEVYCR